MDDEQAEQYAAGIQAQCKPCPFCGELPGVEAWLEFTREVECNMDFKNEPGWKYITLIDPTLALFGIHYEYIYRTCAPTKEDAMHIKYGGDNHK